MGGGNVEIDGGDSSDVGEEVTLNIRCSNGSKFSVQVQLNSTVEVFKSILGQKCEISPQQQRLIYKGRILKDDQTLRSYGFEADHTVHLVRGFAPSARSDGDAGVQNTDSRSTTDAGSNEGEPFGGSAFLSAMLPELGVNGLGNGNGLFGAGHPEMRQMQRQLSQNPDMISEMLNIPLVQNMMNNPEIIRNMLTSNPQLRELMDNNPQIAHVLNDPATLRQAMEAARNPEIMREMMRNTDRQMSNIESSPEGFNMLRRMYENVQEPFLNATSVTGANVSGLGSNPFSALVGAQGLGPDGENSSRSTTTHESLTTPPVPNTIPLPNPWASAGSGPQTNPQPSVHGGPGGAGSPDIERILGTMPDLSYFNQLMQNPAISQMVSSLLSNPQYMNQILGLNPQIQRMLDSFPQFRAMMQNPEFIRQLTSPETMQQLLNFPQGLLSQVGQQTTREPVPNTRGTGGNLGLGTLMNLFAGLSGEGGISTQNRAQAPPEELYATQLSQLRDMGFFDVQENIRALMATAGNVHAAVERLLENGGQ